MTIEVGSYALSVAEACLQMATERGFPAASKRMISANQFLAKQLMEAQERIARLERDNAQLQAKLDQARQESEIAPNVIEELTQLVEASAQTSAAAQYDQAELQGIRLAVQSLSETLYGILMAETAEDGNLTHELMAQANDQLQAMHDQGIISLPEPQADSELHEIHPRLAGMTGDRQAKGAA